MPVESVGEGAVTLCVLCVWVCPLLGTSTCRGADREPANAPFGRRPAAEGERQGMSY